MLRTTAITGYACACTPYTDYCAGCQIPLPAPPGLHKITCTAPDQTSGPKYSGRADAAIENGVAANTAMKLGHAGLGGRPRTGPGRKYHFENWTPPPTRPAVVLDPFGGTGTTALVASVLGRHGISVDLSADYCRLAAWRTTDPGERARAMEVPKPPPVPDGQEALFTL